MEKADTVDGIFEAIHQSKPLTQDQQPHNVEIINYKKANYNEIINNLFHINWYSLLNNPDVNINRELL